MRGYLAGLTNTQAALKRWVDDTKLVLDRLSAVPARGPREPARRGARPHAPPARSAIRWAASWPASSASTIAAAEAGLNLDGIPQSGTVIDGAMQRPFMMVYSARPGRVGANDPIYRTAARPHYRADVKDTRHLDFTDMVFWGGPLRERPILGTLAPGRITEITRLLVRQLLRPGTARANARRCRASSRRCPKSRFAR